MFTKPQQRSDLWWQIYIFFPNHNPYSFSFCHKKSMWLVTGYWRWLLDSLRYCCTSASWNENIPYNLNRCNFNLYCGVTAKGGNIRLFTDIGFRVNSMMLIIKPYTKVNVKQCLHSGMVDSDEIYCQAAVSKLSTQNKHSTFPCETKNCIVLFSLSTVA